MNYYYFANNFSYVPRFLHIMIIASKLKKTNKQTNNDNKENEPHTRSRFCINNDNNNDDDDDDDDDDDTDDDDDDHHHHHHYRVLLLFVITIINETVEYVSTVVIFVFLSGTFEHSSARERQQCELEKKRKNLLHFSFMPFAYKRAIHCSRKSG